MSGGHPEHPFLILGLCQRAHVIHVCFKDRPSSQLSGHMGPLNQDVLNSGAPLAASSTLLCAQAHHVLPAPLPGSPSCALSSRSSTYSLQHPSSGPPVCMYPLPSSMAPHWLPRLPGFLGSPQYVSHSLSQLCLFTHPTLMEQVLRRTVIDSVGYNSEKSRNLSSGLITQSMRRLFSQ